MCVRSQLSCSAVLALQFPVCCVVLVVLLLSAVTVVLWSYQYFNCGHCLGVCFCSSLLCVASRIHSQQLTGEEEVGDREDLGFLQPR